MADQGEGRWCEMTQQWSALRDESKLFLLFAFHSHQGWIITRPCKRSAFAVVDFSKHSDTGNLQVPIAGQATVHHRIHLSLVSLVTFMQVLGETA